jgi:hypothetical protein
LRLRKSTFYRTPRLSPGLVTPAPVIQWIFAVDLVRKRTRHKTRGRRHHAARRATPRSRTLSRRCRLRRLVRARFHEAKAQRHSAIAVSCSRRRIASDRFWREQLRCNQRQSEGGQKGDDAEKFLATHVKHSPFREERVLARHRAEQELTQSVSMSRLNE